MKRWMALFLVVALLASAEAKPGADVLRIGNSVATSAEAESRGKGATETLQDYIRDETGLNPEIVRFKDWREIVNGLAKGELKVGLFQGFEFAWAREQQPKLTALALGINAQRYPTVIIVTAATSSAKEFSGLRGKSISIPTQSQPILKLVVDSESKKAGSKTDEFFSKVVTNQSVEDALDDIVDGKMQVAAVDRTALDAFKRRKSGRYSQLMELMSSQPLPPVVVAYHPDQLDAPTREKFEGSLLGAGKKDRGRNVLSLFRLTEFESAPTDFDKMLADTRKAFPAEK